MRTENDLLGDPEAAAAGQLWPAEGEASPLSRELGDTAEASEAQRSSHKTAANICWALTARPARTEPMPPGSEDFCSTWFPLLLPHPLHPWSHPNLFFLWGEDYLSSKSKPKPHRACKDFIYYPLPNNFYRRQKLICI